MGKIINLDDYRENKRLLATRQNMKSILSDELMKIYIEERKFWDGISENKSNEREYLEINLKDLLEIEEDESELNEEEVELLE